MLAFATFVYDTLDVATRLGRYLLEELLRLRGAAGRWIATALTLGLPMLYLVLAPGTVVVDGKPQPTWLVVWTIFGSSNQLLAALTLLFLAAWVSKGDVGRTRAGAGADAGDARGGASPLASNRRPSRALFVRLPAFFMLATTICALALQLRQNVTLAVAGPGLLSAPGINALLALALIAIALAFTYEWWRGVRALAPSVAHELPPSSALR